VFAREKINKQVKGEKKRKSEIDKNRVKIKIDFLTKKYNHMRKINKRFWFK